MDHLLVVLHLADVRRAVLACCGTIGSGYEEQLKTRISSMGGTGITRTKGRLIGDLIRTIRTSSRVWTG